MGLNLTPTESMDVGDNANGPRRLDQSGSISGGPRTLIEESGTQAPHRMLGATGRISFTDAVCDDASKLAAADYADCLSEDFCGESVRDTLLPTWLGNIDMWLPTGDLHEMGLSPRSELARLYATCGVEPHIDDMDGLSVGIVLHSDGFTFRQCGNCLKLRAGDWFIFDDRLEHEVMETSEATTLLVLTTPLRPL